MAPSPYIFIISIDPVDMNKYARFDEIPSMTLKDIKETKRYGRTDVKKYTHPQTQFAGGIKTSFAKIDIVIKWVKVNSWSSFI